MSKRELYEQKTEELLLPIVEQHQFELVDVELSLIHIYFL